jgi:hypothetical protein
MPASGTGDLLNIVIPYRSIAAGLYISGSELNYPAFAAEANLDEKVAADLL